MDVYEWTPLWPILQLDSSPASSGPSTIRWAWPVSGNAYQSMAFGSRYFLTSMIGRGERVVIECAKLARERQSELFVKADGEAAL